MAISTVYVVASATPFVPGAENGLALIVVFGSRIVLLVYICMVLALVLAYCIGRFVPAPLHRCIPRLSRPIKGARPNSQDRKTQYGRSSLDAGLAVAAPTRAVFAEAPQHCAGVSF